jgi:dCMP deaminase
MSRISRDDYFMGVAGLGSLRATCKRRRVGCVLINSHGHIIATGYNGVPAGYPHCQDQPCPGADAPSGSSLDKCFAIHAEQNALLQCPDVHTITACYTTVSPCIQCVKLLLNTSCQEIVFMEEYPHSDSQRLWEQGGRTWRKLL